MSITEYEYFTYSICKIVYKKCFIYVIGQYLLVVSVNYIVLK